MWAKRSCCDRGPLDRNLEAAEGDRTEAAVRLFSARCILIGCERVLNHKGTKETRRMGIKTRQKHSMKRWFVGKKENSNAVTVKSRIQSSHKKLELLTSKGMTRQLASAKPQMASFLFYNFLWGSACKTPPRHSQRFSHSHGLPSIVRSGQQRLEVSIFEKAQVEAAKHVRMKLPG